MIFMYAAMGGVPALLFLYLISSLLLLKLEIYILTILIATGLFVFSVLGFYESYSYKPDKSKIISPEVYRAVNYTSKEPRKSWEKELTVKVKRFNNLEKRFDECTYKVEADKYSTVLGSLIKIKERLDPTLSVRYSCRMGICGSCGMVVNGKPVLACETNAFESITEKGIEVEPMQAQGMLRDLVVDLDEFFEKHKSVAPYLFREDKKEKYEAKEAYKQTKEELSKYLPYSYCIMCSLCLDACPVVNTNPEFIGPQALSQVYRYHEDSRDQKGSQRLESIDSVLGVWGCEFAGSCSKACPKGVDPASAIQLLKGEVVKNIVIKDEKND